MKWEITPSASRRCWDRHRWCASLRDVADDPARIPGRKDSVWDIASDNASGTDDGARSDAHTRKDDRASADPDVRADVDRLPEFCAAAELGIEWMHRRVDLHRRAEQREVSDPNRAHVQNDTVEIEEH